MKDPAFLFYPNDWLGGTMGMTYEEKGAYIDALVMQWNCHRIANADAKWMLGDALWERVKKKFKEDSQGFYNERLEIEIQKRSQYSSIQKDNALKRWKKEDMPMQCDGIANAEARECLSFSSSFSDNKENTKTKVLEKKVKKLFAKPSEEEVIKYGFDYYGNDFSVEEGSAFFDYWESFGWNRNGKTMKDWQASLRYWHSNQQKFKGGKK